MFFVHTLTTPLAVREDLSTLLPMQPEWAGHRFREFVADAHGRIDVPALRARWRENPGPIVVSSGLHTATFGLLENRLGALAVVQRYVAPTFAAITEAAEVARHRFLQGEPQVPRKLAIAVLLIRKLRGRGSRGMWGGRDKGYLRVDDLANGGGFVPAEQGIAEEVANDLRLAGLFITKTGDRRTKYALNPQRVQELHRLADDLVIPTDRLRGTLRAGGYLDACRLADCCTLHEVRITPHGRKRDCFQTLGAALNHALALPDGEYVIELVYDGRQVQQEPHLTRQGLCELLTNLSRA